MDCDKRSDVAHVKSLRALIVSYKPPEKQYAKSNADEFASDFYFDFKIPE